MKKIIVGVILSLVVMTTLGTVAFAAPDPNNVPCMAFCNPNSPQGILCGAGANLIAQGLYPLGGPGASGHAQVNGYFEPLR